MVVRNGGGGSDVRFFFVRVLGGVFWGYWGFFLVRFGFFVCYLMGFFCKNTGGFGPN